VYTFFYSPLGYGRKDQVIPIHPIERIQRL
jgi:hypothetical protein